MIRKLLITVFTFLLMLLVTALTVPFLIPAEEYATQVKKLIREQTGREVEIAGSMHFTLLPELALTAEDITIGNRAGFASPKLAQLGKLQLSLQLMPLLQKKIVVDALTLEAPEIWLEQTASGKQNWQFLQDKPKAPSSPSKDKSEGFHFALDNLKIKDALFHFYKPGFTVSGRDISLEGSSKKFALEGILNYVEEPFYVKLNLADPFSVWQGKSAEADLKVEHQGGSVGFDGLVTRQHAKGALTLHVRSIAKVMETLGKTAPSTLEVPLTLESMAAEITTDKLVLAPLEATVDSQKIRGSLTVALQGEIPEVSGELAIPELFWPEDAPTQAEANKNQNDASTKGWSEEAIDLSGLRKLNGKLAITIGRLQLSQLSLEDMAANLHLKKGIMEAQISRVNLMDGAAEGQLLLNAAHDVAQWQVAAKLSHLALEKALALVWDDPKLTGTMNSELRLTSTGRSQQEWMENLSGDGRLMSKDGLIKGYALPKLFRNLKAENTAKDNTAYSEIALRFHANQGVATVEEGRLRSPSLMAALSGNVNLGGRRVDMMLKPGLVPQFSAENVEAAQSMSLLVPLKIVGKFENINIRPDLKAAMGEAMQNPDQIKALKGEGKAVIKGLEGQKDTIKESWKELKKGKSPEALGKLLNTLDQSGLPVPKLLDGLKNPSGQPSSGAGTGEQPDAGAGADSGGQDSGQQPPAADQGGTATEAGN